MLKYIYSDLSRAVRYLPYGLALGVPVAVFIVWLINRRCPGFRWSFSGSTWPCF